MALRLIEIVLQKKNLEEIRNFLECHDIIEHRELKLYSDKMLVRILLEAEQSGPVLNFLDKNFAEKNNRLVIIPVEAVIPRLEEIESVTIKKQKSTRISSEELYEDIQASGKYTRTYVAMLILATIVAAVGLHNNSVLSILGAMVIAPMLGPILALSLGIVLGDSKLLLRSLFTAIAGILIVVFLSWSFSNRVVVDPTLSEIASRTIFKRGDLVVALASGCAGAIAFTSGLAESIIGVMVAVSLLPPLVTFAMLVGAGYSYLAIGALELFILNFVSVNLASVIVFLVQGIYPINFKQKHPYFKFMYILILASWLFVLFLMLVFFKIEFL